MSDLALSAAIRITQAVPTPAPTTPGYSGDEADITPTWVGFVATFLVAILTVLLLVDMNRRVRRVRYREEVRVKLEAEAAEAAASSSQKKKS
ncbi:hypothetical protein EYE40_08310 [Glaciihabitans arcticus]|uniref:Transmembrane protein n=1 Tax=Glaciihabitans arcticus TaxID=2668039 RepID=A0A4Q9GUW4_9MICO|nr:hypothetical protein EYE40_08310 [Glaciihabitans arcticus]